MSQLPQQHVNRIRWYSPMDLERARNESAQRPQRQRQPWTFPKLTPEFVANFKRHPKRP